MYLSLSVSFFIENTEPINVSEEDSEIVEKSSYTTNAEEDFQIIHTHADVSEFINLTPNSPNSGK